MLKSIAAMFTENANTIFRRAIADYHACDEAEHRARNPYPERTIEYLLYLKCWVDTVQWHLEDIIRKPDIDPRRALMLKRRIDASNQLRTDLVEYIDQWFMERYGGVTPRPGARKNTETPAWAIDRLSILALKIYHMKRECARAGADAAHRARCRSKLDVLLTQQEDLCEALEELIADIERGDKVMRTYKQMKMYNDPTLNPVLYGEVEVANSGCK